MTDRIDLKAAHAERFRQSLNLADLPAFAHSERFRKVSNRYPHTVAIAYGRDIARAAGETDEQVAATVAEWERAQGLPPTDWRAVGAYERGEHEELDRLPAGYLDAETSR